MTMPFGLPEKYWNSLSSDHQSLYRKVRPLPNAAYSCDVHLNGLEKFLADQKDAMESMGGSFELSPDFQRGTKDVWSDEQRVRYVESLLRYAAPTRILFNCPGWERGPRPEADIPAYTFWCVDGLQRLTAVLQFMQGRFNVFDGYSAESLKGSPFDPRKYRLQVAIFEFDMRADLLTHYIDLNSGGTPHPPAEIQRVRMLLEEALGASGVPAESDGDGRDALRLRG